MIAVSLALVGVAPEVGSAGAAFNPNGLKIFPVEGVAFTATVANFTDPGGGKGTYKATIDWGDGTISDGKLVSTGKDNANDVTGQHTYAEEGNYELKVTITGGSGGGQASPTAEVTDAPLAAKVSVPAVAESSVLTDAIATFTDPDPNDKSSEYTVTIDWGDGSTGPGTVNKTGPGAFSVSGNHAYADEGPRTVGVTVRDGGGATVTATQAITVVDAALTAGAPLTRRGTEGRPGAGAVATFRDANTAATAADYTAATINWGDGTTSPGTIGPAPGGGWQVGGSHTYREEGRYATTVAVTDRGGATMAARGAAVIGDAPLRALSQRITGGLKFRGVVATFTDAAGKSAKLGDYNVTINWGDGRSSAGSVARSHGHFAVLGAHAYASAGLKRVTVSIHDRGGAAATAHSRATIST
jgi:PKD repeat protein